MLSCECTILIYTVTSQSKERFGIMEEFSLYVLDITMNSVRAGATDIRITLTEKDGMLTFSVTDNGCGMKAEQVKNLKDPFFTTRKTRAVGLGVPFLTMLAEQTGGGVDITSRYEGEYPESHGTTVTATFGMDHIDFIPLGDMVSTVTTLIQGSPHVNFTFTHETPKGKVELSTRQLRELLGGEVSLAELEILEWIRGYLIEGYAEIKTEN